MRLDPKASMIRDLKRRIAVMEAHRRNFTRLIGATTYNPDL